MMKWRIKRNLNVIFDIFLFFTLPTQAIKPCSYFFGLLVHKYIHFTHSLLHHSQPYLYLHPLPRVMQ